MISAKEGRESERESATSWLFPLFSATSGD